MPEKASKFSDKLKFWGVVISAVLSTLATILGVWIKSTTAKESSMKVLVEQLNDVIIPKLEQALDKQTDMVSRLRDQNADLRERLTRVETTVDMWKLINHSIGTVGAGTPLLPSYTEKETDNSPQPNIENTKSKKFPRLDMQQILEK